VVLIDTNAFSWCQFLGTIEFEKHASLCKIERMAVDATRLPFVSEFAFPTASSSVTFRFAHLFPIRKNFQRPLGISFTTASTALHWQDGMASSDCFAGQDFQSSNVEKTGDNLSAFAPWK
jgi:hypothetical protein